MTVIDILLETKEVKFNDIDMKNEDSVEIIVCRVIAEEEFSDVEQKFLSDHKINTYLSEINGLEYTFYVDLEPDIRFFKGHKDESRKNSDQKCVEESTCMLEQNKYHHDIDFKPNNDICKRECYNTRWRKRHPFQHQWETVYRCRICGDDLQSDISLISHMKTHCETSIHCCHCKAKRILECGLDEKNILDVSNLSTEKCKTAPASGHAGNKEYQQQTHWKDSEESGKEDRINGSQIEKATRSENENDTKATINDEQNQSVQTGTQTEQSSNYSDASALPKGSARRIEATVFKEDFAHMGEGISALEQFNEPLPSYVCNVCHKSYDLPRRLRRHYLTHFAPKSYTCDLCDKRFSLKSYLTAHIESHLRQRTVCCEICSKGFSRQSNLNHVRTLHSVFHCLVCDRKFLSLSHLRRHEMHHKVRSEGCSD